MKFEDILCDYDYDYDYDCDCVLVDSEPITHTELQARLVVIAGA
ncbi:hypothetical protein RCH06_002766 [Polaromonas sp. CG_9.5]|nr:hypothetical protein [Polaromonas sp. CG_9.5]